MQTTLSDAPSYPHKDVLRHYNEKAQDAEYVALQNYGIADLGPLLAQLSKLTKMKRLNLSGNNLARLPDDLSSFSALETLDVARNAFPNADSVLAGLMSIPRLRHLKINLSEAEENKLVATLTSVRTINGVELDDEDEDDLDPESQQRRAEEAAAKEVAPPPRGYDISAQGVKMHLDYKPWTAKDAEKFGKLYEQIGSVSGKVSLPDEYKDFSRTVLAHLKSRTANEADVLKLQCHQFNASALLLEFSFDELVRVCSRYGPDVSNALQGVFEQHLGLMRMASITMAVMQEDRDRRIAALQEDLRKEILLRERTQRAYEASFGATVVGGRIQYSEAEMRKEPDYGTTLRRKPIPQQEHFHKNLRGDGNVTKGAHLHPPVDGYESGVAAAAQHSGMQLKELRQFVSELLKSKAASDEANAMARLPPETLEQHIYTLICSKISQPENIKSRVKAVYEALSVYAKSEVDIELIDRVIGGTLDEAYILRHSQQEGIVFDAIHAAMTGSGSGTNSAVGVDEYLGEKQAKDVIDGVVPWPADRRARLTQLISRRMSRREHDPEEFAIHFKTLARNILKFLLEERVTELQQLAEGFTSTDEDRTGVIDVNQFKQIIFALFPTTSARTVQQLAVSADPFDNNVVNFNTTVRVAEAYRASIEAEGSAAILREIEQKRAHLFQQDAPSRGPPREKRDVGGGAVVGFGGHHNSARPSVSDDRSVSIGLGGSRPPSRGNSQHTTAWPGANDNAAQSHTHQFTDEYPRSDGFDRRYAPQSHERATHTAWGGHQNQQNNPATDDRAGFSSSVDARGAAPFRDEAGKYIEEGANPFPKSGGGWPTPPNRSQQQQQQGLSRPTNAPMTSFNVYGDDKKGVDRSYGFIDTRLVMPGLLPSEGLRAVHYVQRADDAKSKTPVDVVDTPTAARGGRAGR